MGFEDFDLIDFTYEFKKTTFENSVNVITLVRGFYIRADTQIHE